MPSKLAVLTFHAIGKERAPTFFPEDLFREFISLLYRKGWRTLSLRQVMDHLEKREMFPSRSLALTFDDGFQSLFTGAYPPLREHDMTGLVFLIASEQWTKEGQGSFEGRPLLSRDQVLEMRGAGFEFGSHTMTHSDLTKLPLRIIREEMFESRARLEPILGGPVEWFAYPYGNHNSSVRQLAEQYYRGAFSDRLGMIQQGGNRWAIRRVEMYYFQHPALLPFLFSPILPWYLCLRDVPRRLGRRWRAHDR